MRRRARLRRRRTGSQAMHEVIRRPWPGELHVAVFQEQAGGGVFVLVAFDALVIDQMSDIEQHFAAVHALAGDFLIEWAEHAMHLGRNRAGLGLALALAAGNFSQVGEIFFADRLGDGSDGWRKITAAIVERDLEMHLGLTPKAVEISQEVALVGADGAAEGLIILINGAKTEGKDG